MAVAAREKARRVPFDEPLPSGFSTYDYADAYDVEIAATDPRSAEEFAREALERSPAALRRFIVSAHRYVLRFRLAPLDAPGHVLGWRIVEATPDLVRLEAESPLARATLVGRRVEPTRVRLTTVLAYRRPVIIRAIWTAVGPAHRRIAPYLLDRAARSGPR
jgi:hypothetical protein